MTEDTVRTVEVEVYNDFHCVAIENEQNDSIDTADSIDLINEEGLAVDADPLPCCSHQDSLNKKRLQSQLDGAQQQIVSLRTQLEENAHTNRERERSRILYLAYINIILDIVPDIIRVFLK